MEIPELVRGRLGDETIETAVSLGDEDVVCFTPSQTLVYRGEGLLSDEAVSGYSHDVERLAVSEGRRKVKFVLQYVDGSESFTVPESRADAVLERLVDGIFGTVGILDSGESVAGVFRFSELTLTVTDARLVKHVGEPVWDDDFEEFHYENVTGLSFEEGSVATQIVLSVNGRSERIKAPTDEAPMVRQTLTTALFDYYDVESLTALNQLFESRTDDDAADPDRGGDIDLDDGLSPLVGGDDDGSVGGEQESPADDSASASDERRTAGSDAASPTGSDAAPSTGRDSASSTGGAGSRAAAGDTASDVDRVDPEAIEAMQEQLGALTEVVKRQNELLEQQQETVNQLIEELRRGR